MQAATNAIVAAKGREENRKNNEDGNLSEAEEGNAANDPRPAVEYVRHGCSLLPRHSAQEFLSALNSRPLPLDQQLHVPNEHSVDDTLARACIQSRQRSSRRSRREARRRGGTSAKTGCVARVATPGRTAGRFEATATAACGFLQILFALIMLFLAGDWLRDSLRLRVFTVVAYTKKIASVFPRPTPTTASPWSFPVCAGFPVLAVAYGESSSTLGDNGGEVVTLLPSAAFRPTCENPASGVTMVITPHHGGECLVPQDKAEDTLGGTGTWPTGHYNYGVHQRLCSKATPLCLARVDVHDGAVPDPFASSVYSRESSMTTPELERAGPYGSNLHDHATAIGAPSDGDPPLPAPLNTPDSVIFVGGAQDEEYGGVEDSGIPLDSVDVSGAGPTVFSPWRKWAKLWKLSHK